MPFIYAYETYLLICIFIYFHYNQMVNEYFKIILKLQSTPCNVLLSSGKILNI